MPAGRGPVDQRQRRLRAVGLAAGGRWRIRAVTRPRTALLALVPFLLHALAREVDRGLGLVLRAEIEPPGCCPRSAGRRRPTAPPWRAHLALWLAAGLAVWLALAWWRRRERQATWPRRPAGEAVVFAPLLLRPALTLLALVSVARAAVLPLRLHAAGGADPGLGDRPGRWRPSRRSSPCGSRPSASPPRGRERSSC